MASAPRGSLIEQRLRSQLLAGRPARSASAVAERLLAVQAQDPRGARLAIRARSEGLEAAHVERAFDQRRLVVSWLNRGTLHLVRGEDHHWLHALTTPPLRTASARRLSQEGVSPAMSEKGVGIIERALIDEGPLTRLQLRERLQSGGVRTEGQALVHLLLAATLRGVAVRGPMTGREQAYVLVSDWLGEPAPVEREQALGELALRYLRGHQPADARDLARWAGLPLRDARAGLARISSRLRERADGLLELRRGGASAAAAAPAPRLLGSFEPLLLGWCSREELLGENQGKVTIGGLFKPFALVDGKAVATWSLKDGTAKLEPFGRLSAEASKALREDGEAVLRFLASAR